MTQIEEAIVSGKLSPGEKLPSERDLIKIFNTSRGPVREALKSLEQKKLIEIRAGSGGGATVCPMGTDLLRETLGLLVRHRIVPEGHMAEFREVIEGLAASLAAERITPEQFDSLVQMREELNDLISDDKLETFWSRERQLHRLLAKASGNLMCEWVVDTINQEISSYQSLYPVQRNRAQEALSDWSAIIKALENSQGSRASSLIKAHVVHFSLLGDT